MNFSNADNRKKTHRTLCRALLVAWVCGFSLTGFTADTEAKERVQDPAYGVALWHYFQGRHMQALTELMMAERRGGIQGHAENPAIMMAGLQLAYGMTNTSKSAFEALINENSSDSARDTAWYYLADINYQRGDLDAASLALDQLSATDSRLVQSAFAHKAQQLELNILIQQDRLDEAAELVDEGNGNRLISPLSLFNLGNAYSRQGQYQRAETLFNRALSDIFDSEIVREQDLLLADKIRTAAGYAALLREDRSLAISYFRFVQQDSLNSELAMLGYGRSAAELGRYPDALKYFDQLTQKASFHPAVQQSFIGVASVYEQMQRPGAALAAYNSAISTYDTRVAQLDAQIERLQQQDLSALQLPDRGSHWISQSEDAMAKPVDGAFAELFSENRIQADLRQLQDLIHLQAMADEHANRLAILQESLQLRLQLRESNWARYQTLDSGQNLDLYGRQISQHQQDLNLVQSDQDYLALIEPDQQALLNRVENSRQRLKNLQSSGDYGDDSLADDSLKEKQRLLRVYGGLLHWQAAQDFAQNSYVQQQNLAKANAELDALAGNRGRLEILLLEAPDFNPYFQRVAVIEQNSDITHGHLQQKLAQVKSAVFAEMVAQLEDHKSNIRSYLTQARLASLRIYEQNNRVSFLQPAEAEEPAAAAQEKL